MQRVVLIDDRKKKWREADDWLTLLYAVLGSSLALVAAVMGATMR
jgi:hypothetical protein